MVYNPALTTSIAGPMRQTRTLVEHCKDTLSKFLEGFGCQAGHPVQYAYIIDGSYKRFVISIYDEKEFPQDAEDMEHVDALDYEGRGTRYAVLGTMRNGKITWSCSEDELKSFFTKDGRSILHGEEVAVQDRIKMRQEQLQKEEQEAAQERSAAKKAVKRSRKGCKEDEDNAGGSSEIQQEDDEDGGALAAAQRKREKRKAKKDRQKVNRAEQAALLKQAHEESIQKAAAQLGGISGMVVDPSTAEGQAKLKEVTDRGSHSIYSMHQLPK